MPTPTRADWLSILFLGLVWGGTFMVVAIALRGYGPVTVACARTSLGAVALGITALVLRRTWPAWHLRTWAHILPMGVCSTALPYFLLSWGQQYVPSAFAGLSMAILPLFVLPMAHLFVGEMLTLRKAGGFRPWPDRSAGAAWPRCLGGRGGRPAASGLYRGHAFLFRSPPS